jgi:hypothetical protein
MVKLTERRIVNPTEKTTNSLRAYIIVMIHNKRVMWNHLTNQTFIILGFGHFFEGFFRESILGQGSGASTSLVSGSLFRPMGISICLGPVSVLHPIFMIIDFSAILTVALVSDSFRSTLRRPRLEFRKRLHLFTFSTTFHMLIIPSHLCRRPAEAGQLLSITFVLNR